jgi:hypothetical protein
MWRPLEVLPYDWWSMLDERRQVRRILAAPVSIRYEGITPSPTSEVTSPPSQTWWTRRRCQASPANHMITTA